MSVFSSMADRDPGQMGGIHCIPRVQAGISRDPIFSVPKLKALQRSSKKSTLLQGIGSLAVPRGDHRSTLKGARFRFLFKPLCDPKTKQRRQTHSGSKISKSIFKHLPFPNGNYSISGRHPIRRRIHDVYRHQGRIFTCALSILLNKSS